jgi:hypothetical protein
MKYNHNDEVLDEVLYFDERDPHTLAFNRLRFEHPLFAEVYTRVERGEKIRDIAAAVGVPIPAAKRHNILAIEFIERQMASTTATFDPEMKLYPPAPEHRTEDPELFLELVGDVFDTEWARKDAVWTFKKSQSSGSLVYFLYSESQKALKVGTTRDIKNRLAGLQTGAPEPLYLLGVMKGDAHIERLIHKKFEGIRMRGEWFRLTDDLVDFVNRATE